MHDSKAVEVIVEELQVPAWLCPALRTAMPLHTLAILGDIILEELQILI